MPTLNSLRESLKQVVNQEAAKLAEFKNKLDASPVIAFKYVDTIMCLSARAHIAQLLVTRIENWEAAYKAGILKNHQPKSPEEALVSIRQNIIRNALEKNRYTNQSTSFSSNAMERFEAAYYAEMASDWELIF